MDVTAEVRRRFPDHGFDRATRFATAGTRATTRIDVTTEGAPFGVDMLDGNEAEAFTRLASIRERRRTAHGGL